MSRVMFDSPLVVAPLLHVRVPLPARISSSSAAANCCDSSEKHAGEQSTARRTKLEAYLVSARQGGKERDKERVSD